MPNESPSLNTDPPIQAALPSAQTPTSQRSQARPTMSVLSSRPVRRAGGSLLFRGIIENAGPTLDPKLWREVFSFLPDPDCVNIMHVSKTMRRLGGASVRTLSLKGDRDPAQDWHWHWFTGVDTLRGALPHAVVGAACVERSLAPPHCSPTLWP